MKLKENKEIYSTILIVQTTFEEWMLARIIVGIHTCFFPIVCFLIDIMPRVDSSWSDRKFSPGILFPKVENKFPWVKILTYFLDLPDTICCDKICPLTNKYFMVWDSLEIELMPLSFLISRPGVQVS